MGKFMVAGKQGGLDNVFLKVLHNGFSGSGKTTAMAKAPKPFIIEPASQAIPSIVASNPEALVFVPENINDLRSLIDVFQRHKVVSVDGLPGIEIQMEGQSFQIHSIVIDDFEWIVEFFRMEIQGKRPEFDFTKWGLLIDRIMKFLKFFIEIPVNIHVGLKVENITDNNQQIHGFALAGSKLKSKLPGLFNAMCHHFRTRPDEHGQEYFAMFNGPEKFITKSHPAFENIELPEPSIWWKKMRSAAGMVQTKTAVQNPATKTEKLELGSKQSSERGKEGSVRSLRK